jgi:hypothetical protein
MEKKTEKGSKKKLSLNAQSIKSLKLTDIKGTEQDKFAPASCCHGCTKSHLAPRAM